MRSKIEEMVFLYNKENEAEDCNTGKISARRLTFDEIMKNRKDAIKTLMDMPKSDLVDYILGKDKVNYQYLKECGSL